MFSAQLPPPFIPPPPPQPLLADDLFSRTVCGSLKRAYIDRGREGGSFHRPITLARVCLVVVFSVLAIEPGLVITVPSVMRAKTRNGDLCLHEPFRVHKTESFLCEIRLIVCRPNPERLLTRIACSGDRTLRHVEHTFHVLISLERTPEMLFSKSQN